MLKLHVEVSDLVFKFNFVGDSYEDSQEKPVDLGSPRREFFRLLLPDLIRNSGMIQGIFLVITSQCIEHVFSYANRFGAQP